MNLRLIASFPIPMVQTPEELKSTLAPIIPSPIPADLTIELIPPSTIRVSYTLSFTDVLDAAQALFTLITVTWPTFVNAATPPPEEP